MADPMAKIEFHRDETGAVYTAANIRQRIELLNRVRETWRGVPDYVELIGMEIWALETAAQALEVAYGAVSKAAFVIDAPADFTEVVRWRCAMTACQELLTLAAKQPEA